VCVIVCVCLCVYVCVHVFNRVSEKGVSLNKCDESSHTFCEHVS